MLTWHSFGNFLLLFSLCSSVCTCAWHSSPLYPTSRCRFLFPFAYLRFANHMLNQNRFPLPLCLFRLVLICNCFSSRLLLFLISVSSSRSGGIFYCIYCGRSETSNGRANLYASRASPSQESTCRKRAIRPAPSKASPRSRTW